MASNKRIYNQVTKLYNVDIVEDLADADPTHYALIIDPAKSNIIDLPLMNILKLYLENKVPHNPDSKVRTVQLELPEGMELR